MSEASHLRIGELSRRAGVSPELLRAWERRYDLLRPTRSPGGLRLYSLEDLERVRLMSRHIADGLAAREAAALASRAALGPEGGEATAGGAPGAALDAEAARARLARAVDQFDEPAAQAVIDELLAVATVDALLSEAVVPFLRDIGDRWERGELSVAQEHFASNLLRGRLLGLARGWGRGAGPRALLACPPGERHDLGLIAFGLALRARGWRIDFLGSDTPVESIVGAVRTVRPRLVVVSAASAELLTPMGPQLAELAREREVAVAGAGARDFDPGDSDVLVLTRDPVAEAEGLAGRQGLG
ncbi:MAG TPA: B12-binding domain-containing protein [Thermoleophilaceae bacterium]|nr:B12-binding domain-containing protein [Thermoleophilaceae bacterium]